MNVMRGVMAGVLVFAVAVAVVACIIGVLLIIRSGGHDGAVLCVCAVVVGAIALLGLRIIANDR